MTKEEFLKTIGDELYQAYEEALRNYFKCSFCESAPKFIPLQFTFQADVQGLEKWMVSDYKGRQERNEEKQPAAGFTYFPVPDLIVGWLRVRIDSGPHARGYRRLLVCPLCAEKLMKDQPELFA